MTKGIDLYLFDRLIGLFVPKEKQFKLFFASNLTLAASVMLMYCYC